MKILKISIFLFIFLTPLFSIGQPDLSILNKGNTPKIGVKNTVLAKVHGKTITVIDIMKKMDYTFSRSYPNLTDSEPARYQFYTASWKHVLNDMINTQLILADAESKELKVTDSEVRKEMESRFGPNILISLDRMGLSYDDAWNMLKDELIVQRMSWFRVNSKALQKITPENIRKAYAEYCIDNPPKKQWKYQIVSIRSSDEEAAKQKVEKIHQLCVESNKSLEELRPKIDSFHEENLTIQLSNQYQVLDSDLSNTYKQVLSSLKNDSYSHPLPQKTRNSNETLYRIFYLEEAVVELPPSFKEIANKLEEDLLQQAISHESSNYIEKLRKYYDYDHQKIDLPDYFEPFTIE